MSNRAGLNTGTSSDSEVIFVHGWGLGAEVWATTAAQMSKKTKTRCLNLPGFGGRKLRQPFTLDHLIVDLEESTNPGAAWIAWSMGGLLAIALAHKKPGWIKKLLLVSSTPCFIEKNDWPHGLKKSVLDDFSRQLDSDYDATIKRFLALQARGGFDSRNTLKTLRKNCLNQSPPDQNALKGGLGILKTADMRSQLLTLTIPITMILGERDSIVDSRIGNVLDDCMNNLQLCMIQQAGHAPFLSHPEQFQRTAQNFISN